MEFRCISILQKRKTSQIKTEKGDLFQVHIKLFWYFFVKITDKLTCPE